MNDEQPDTGTDDSDTAEQQDEPTGSRPVTVPNVTPGAKSGLAHQVIGSAAQEAYDATNGAELPEVPDGDLDSQVEWVLDAEDSDTARSRAEAVYAKAQSEEDVDLSELSGRLTSAVYGQASAEVPATQAITGDGSGEALPDLPDGDDGNSASDASSGSVNGSADEAVIDSPAAEDDAQGTESGEAPSGDEAAKDA